MSRSLSKWFARLYTKNGERIGRQIAKMGGAERWMKPQVLSWEESGVGDEAISKNSNTNRVEIRGGGKRKRWDGGVAYMNGGDAGIGVESTTLSASWTQFNWEVWLLFWESLSPAILILVFYSAGLKFLKSTFITSFHIFLGRPLP